KINLDRYLRRNVIGRLNSWPHHLDMLGRRSGSKIIVGWENGPGIVLAIILCADFGLHHATVRSPVIKIVVLDREAIGIPANVSRPSAGSNICNKLRHVARVGLWQVD